MLVNGSCLRFAESDKVDDVREYFHEAVMRWFEEVGEGKVMDATLVEVRIFLTRSAVGANLHK